MKDAGWGDVEELKRYGRVFDVVGESLAGETMGVFLAEKLLRIRAKDGQSIPLRPNRAQAEFARRRENRNVVLKARQMGLSTWIAGRFFLKTITQPGTLTLQVAHTQEAAEELFRMVHRFYACLPEEVRAGALKTSRANARSLVFPELDSEYRVETAGDPNAGRGLTVQNLHCSEVARWRGNAAEVLAGLRAALTPGGEVVLESTANGAYGCFYDEWQQAEETGYVQHFFPWWWEAGYVVEGGPSRCFASSVGQPGPAGDGECGGGGEAPPSFARVGHPGGVGEEGPPRRFASTVGHPGGVGCGAGLVVELGEDERRLVERHGLSVEQVWFRRDLQRQFGKLMRQEYPEDADSCFLTTGECVFDVEAVDGRLREVPEPVERRWNGGLEVWFAPQAGRRYVVAVDPSGGGPDGDPCAMQVMERGLMLQCAEFRGRLGLQEIAERAVALAEEYGGALVVVERNNHGYGVLAHLRRMGYPEVYADKGGDGWPTNAVTRPAMIDGVGRALIERPQTLNSRRLLRECRTFVRDRGGRPGAAAGEHDDCVMAMGLAIQAGAFTAGAFTGGAFTGGAGNGERR